MVILNRPCLFPVTTLDFLKATPAGLASFGGRAIIFRRPGHHFSATGPSFFGDRAVIFRRPGRHLSVTGPSSFGDRACMIFGPKPFERSRDDPGWVNADGVQDHGVLALPCPWIKSRIGGLQAASNKGFRGFCGRRRADASSGL